MVLYGYNSTNSTTIGGVYRWTLAGGAVKVIVRGEAVQSISPQAKFLAPSNAQPPLINASGALFFAARIDTAGQGTSADFRDAWFYQAVPGGAVQKVALAGEALSGMPAGSILSSGHGYLNDAGDLLFFAKITIPPATIPLNAIFGGAAPGISLIMASGIPKTVTGITEPITGNVGYTDLLTNVDYGVMGEINARLSTAGEIAFLATYPGPPLVIGSISFPQTKCAIITAGLHGVPAPTPVAQSISFPSPADRLINAPSLTLAATASSGLPVSYNVVSGAATVVGNALSFGATPGLVTVRASQAGNPSFLAAPAIEQSFRLVSSAPELALTLYLAAANVPAADRLASLDLDGDGLINLMEFAMGSAPLISDVQKLPTTTLLSGVLSFVYTRAQTANVDYSVKFPPDLITPWSAVTVNQGTPDLNGLTTATVPVSPSFKGFLRLEVNLRP